MAAEDTGDTPKNISLFRYLVTLGQLGLILLVIHEYSLESTGFLHVMTLVAAGFAVHAWLPHRLRMPFYVALSLASVFVILGFPGGLWAIGLGLVLIGCCHLPLPWIARVILILLIAVMLGVMRVGHVSSPWGEAVWPVVATMFMLRLFVYMYDLKHRTAPFSFTRSLAYFFMLPNVCFAMFPVVDYKRFCTDYYKGNAGEIYQEGVHWIVTGITHLLLYRIVYQFVVIAPESVANGASMMRFMISAYLLYLHLSGQFHIILGVLQLFGFHLPRTHDRYYFATSFTDLWRRINIYWKDFMMKLVFYPLFFKLKGRNQSYALIVSTLTVFFVTWTMHSYQWFWLRGNVLLEWNDALFWAILAILVVVATLREARVGRQRLAAAQSRTLRSRLARACGIVGTFLVMSMLWSMWTSESLSEWLAICGKAGPAFWVLLFGVIIASYVAASILGRPRKEVVATAGRTLSVPIDPFWKSVAASCVILVGAIVIAHPGFYTRGDTALKGVVKLIRDPGLNERDLEKLQRGYYENLVGVNRFDSKLAGVYMKKPADWVGIQDTSAMEETDDFLMTTLVPGAEIEFKRAHLTVNEWGFRDKSYSKTREPGTCRIAVLGASHTMGAGVNDLENFESRLEERLNEECTGGAFQRYEILNFAVGGRSALQNLYAFETDVLGFDQPDAMLLVINMKDSSTRHLAEAYLDHVDIPYEELKDTLHEAGVNEHTRYGVAVVKLRNERDFISQWVFYRFAQICKDRGITPMCVYIPLVNQKLNSKDVEGQLSMAREAGFHVYDLSDAYRGYDRDTLTIAAWDDHPNARAHGIIADRLYTFLVDHRETIPLGLSCEKKDKNVERRPDGNDRTEG